MSWVRVDDKFPRHPKVIALPAAAVALWLAGCCWASEYETDGHLPAAAVERLPWYAPKSVKALEGAGLWVDAGDGWRIHDYLDYQPAAAAREAQRGKAAVRMNKVRSSRNVRANEARCSPDVRIAPYPSRTRPDPLTKESTPSFAGGSPTAPVDALVLSAEKAPAKRKEAVGAPAWAAYAAAYERRYTTPPVRNQKVNVALADLVKRLGAEDAPGVAAYFVGHNGALYVQSGHAVGLLLRDCEKLRTEWATGRRGNAHVARQAEQAEACGFRRIAEELEREPDVVESEAE